MSCGRPVLGQCGGDSGWCSCRKFQSRNHLEREIKTVEELLRELREELEMYPELHEETTDESDDDIEDDEPENSTTTQ